MHTWLLQPERSRDLLCLNAPSSMPRGCSREDPHPAGCGGRDAAFQPSCCSPNARRGWELLPGSASDGRWLHPLGDIPAGAAVESLPKSISIPRGPEWHIVPSSPQLSQGFRNSGCSRGFHSSRLTQQGCAGDSPSLEHGLLWSSSFQADRSWNSWQGCVAQPVPGVGDSQAGGTEAPSSGSSTDPAASPEIPPEPLGGRISNPCTQPTAAATGLSHLQRENESSVEILESRR